METIRIRPVPIVEAEVVVVRQSVEWQKPTFSRHIYGRAVELTDHRDVIKGWEEARRLFRNNRKGQVKIRHGPVTRVSPPPCTAQGRELTEPNRDRRYLDIMRQMQTRLTLHNYTDVDVVFMDQFGMCTTYKPDSRNGYNDLANGHAQFKYKNDNRAEGYVIVRLCYEFDSVEAVRAAHETMTRNLPHIHERDLHDLHAWLAEMLKNCYHNNHDGWFYSHTGESSATRNKGPFLFALEAKIDKDELMLDETIYLRRFNCTLHHAGALRYAHPSTNLEIEPDAFGHGNNELQVDLDTRVRYHSRLPNPKPLYFMMLGEVKQLNPYSIFVSRTMRTSPDKKGECAEVDPDEYIEVYTRLEERGRDGATWQVRRFTLEDAVLRFGLHRNKYEAQAQQLKTEEVLREHLRTQEFLKSENRRQRQEAEDQINELKKKLGSKEEVDRIEREKRGHAQKTNLELLKFFTTLVTAALGLIPLILKASASK